MSTPLHLTLLDPGKTSAADLITLAKQTAEAGTDGFMVGGSTRFKPWKNVDLAVETIKETTHMPVILFPTHASSVSGKQMQFSSCHFLIVKVDNF